MKVLDASFAAKLVIDEEGSDQVRSLWIEWQQHGELLGAPPVFRAETASVLRKRVRRGDIDFSTGDQAFAQLMGLPVRIVETPGLYERAWVLAQELNQPTVYDCVYLALAESLGCEMWTADDTFARLAQTKFPWVRTIAGGPG